MLFAVKPAVGARLFLIADVNLRRRVVAHQNDGQPGHHALGFELLGLVQDMDTTKSREVLARFESVTTSPPTVTACVTVLSEMFPARSTSPAIGPFRRATARSRAMSSDM